VGLGSKPVLVKLVQVSVSGQVVQKSLLNVGVAPIMLESLPECLNSTLAERVRDDLIPMLAPF
jgi:hypothetical protein